MAPLLRDRRRHTAPALTILIALLYLPNGFAASAPTGTINYKFDEQVSLGTRDATVSGGQLTLTQDGGTLITAAKGQGNWTGTVANSRWILTGRVHIVYDTTAMDADTATVVFANKLIQSIEVHGAPAKFIDAGKAAGPPFNGTANTITFDGKTRQVRFADHSWFSRAGVGEGNSGKPLVYNLDSGVLRNEPGGSSAGPIRIILNEGGKTDVRFDGNFTLGTKDNTIAGEAVTISQDGGALITATRAQGSWTDTIANGHWLLTGKAHIEYDTAVLDADTAAVVYASRLMQSIEVHGMPAKFFHPGKTAGQPCKGSADTIVFNGKKREVRFDGHIAYSLGRDEGSADQPMFYSLDSGLLSSPEDGNPDSRVRLTIHPDKPDKHVPTPRTPQRSTAP